MSYKPLTQAVAMGGSGVSYTTEEEMTGAAAQRWEARENGKFKDVCKVFSLDNEEDRNQEARRLGRDLGRGR